MPNHTKGYFLAKKAKQPDNVGGFDYDIVDQDDMIIAEVFEIVGHGLKRPAKENAQLLASSPKMLQVLEKIERKLSIDTTPEATEYPDPYVCVGTMIELHDVIREARGLPKLA